MPQYKYKLARKLIKRTYKFKKAGLVIYDDDDFIISTLRESFIKTPRNEFIDNCNGIIQNMYEALKNPRRYKN